MRLSSYPWLLVRSTPQRLVTRALCTCGVRRVYAVAVTIVCSPNSPPRCVVTTPLFFARSLAGRGTHGRLGTGDNRHIFVPTPMHNQIVHRPIGGKVYMIGGIMNVSLGKDHSAACVAKLDRFRELRGQKKKGRVRSAAKK